MRLNQVTSWAASTDVPGEPGHELAGTCPTATLSWLSPTPSTTGARSPIECASRRA